MMPNNNMNQQQQQQQQQFPLNVNGLQNFPQQQQQLFSNQNVPQEQVLLQNTIQNIYQLLQLQQQNYTYPQNPVFQQPFVVNPQFAMSNVQLVMGQRNPFLQPVSLLTHHQPNLIAPFTNFQNQIVQGVGPQNHNFSTNQLFGMANQNGPLQLINQGQQRFPSPMIDVNASRQLVHVGQTHNPTNFEGNHGNVPPNNNNNSGWVESQPKNFTGHKTNDASVKGFKSHKHAKEKFGKEGSNRFAAVDSSPRTSTSSEKKIPPPNYTEQEIKQWREARKKNYPTRVTELKKCMAEETLSDVMNQEATLRRQELKAILERQAELGIEVAEIPSYYCHCDPDDEKNPRGSNSSSGHRKQNHRGGQKRYNKKGGKFQNKRRTGFQDNQVVTKRPKREFVKQHQSLLQKLLSRDIKRDKNHLLQAFRFMAVNSFFTTNSLTFPSIIVRETNPDVSQETVRKDSEKAVLETICSVLKDSDSGKAVEEETSYSSLQDDSDKAEEEEEGELTE